MTQRDRANRRARAMLAGGALVIAGLVPAGCTKTCEGPASYFPAVYVDATAWFGAHGDRASAQACLGTTCDDLAPDEPSADLTVPRGSYDDPLDVVVVLRASGRTSTERLTVTLGSTSVTGPCGTITNRGRVVDVGADGGLTAAGVRP